MEMRSVPVPHGIRLMQLVSQDRWMAQLIQRHGTQAGNHWQRGKGLGVLSLNQLGWGSCFGSFEACQIFWKTEMQGLGRLAACGDASSAIAAVA